MRLLLLFFVIFAGLSTASLADPWEEAGKVQASNKIVVAWNNDGSVQLLPFWKLALAVDLDSAEEEQLHWAGMLSFLGLSLEEWLDRFQGSGHWSYAAPGSHQLRFQLNPNSELSGLLREKFGSDSSDFHKESGDNIEITCDDAALSLRLGPKPTQGPALEGDPDFRDARKRLADKPCDILLYAEGSGDWEYGVLALDLKARTARGFCKTASRAKLPKPDGIKESIFNSRPPQLQTFIATDLQWLDANFNTLRAGLPTGMNGIGEFLAARRAPGGLFETFRGQGLLGTTGNPAEIVTGVDPQSTFYAVGQYTDLKMVENLLTDLEYQTRLQTLEGCEKNLEAISWALLRWEVDMHREVTPDLEKLVPQMLPELPACPSVGRPTYVLRMTGDKDWVLYCRGHHHPQTPEDFPRFTRYDAGVRGEFRPRADLPHFSRVGENGRASYSLSSGQQISVDTERQMAYLADGADASSFLATPAVQTALPGLARENTDWAGDGLVYLDYFQAAQSVPKLKAYADNEFPGTVEFLIQAFLEGLKQSGTTQASNAVRWEPDGLAYQGLGLWGSPTMVSPLAGLSVWIQSAMRREEVAKGSLCRDNVVTIAKALDAYSKDHDGPYPKTLSELVPQYLPAIPLCPTTGADTYSAGYIVEYYSSLDPHSGYYLLCCKGRNHVRARWQEDQPSYRSEQGEVEPGP